MVARIEQAFPGLGGTGYQVTSPSDDAYNCIAWAAGDTTDWWWPDEPDHPESSHWPSGAPRVETLEAFREAFATLGYFVCGHDQLEAGYEKVALFARAGVPKHAARQLPSGRWTSKLGPMEDLEHALHDLTGTVYGSVVLIPKAAAALIGRRPARAAEQVAGLAAGKRTREATTARRRPHAQPPRREEGERSHAADEEAQAGPAPQAGVRRPERPPR